MKTKLKKLSYWAGVGAVGIVLGVSLQFTRAWVEPTVAPPGGSIGAPINTGSTTQTKSGGLVLDYSEIQRSGEPTLNFHRPGFFATGIKLRGDNNIWFGGWSTGEGAAGLVAGLMYDGNNTGYYVDPNNTSRMNYGVYDNLYSYGWLQSPIFYDANNNGYYVDPASTSRMNYGVYDNIHVYGGINLGGVTRTTWPIVASYNDLPSSSTAGYCRGHSALSLFVIDEVIAPASATAAVGSYGSCGCQSGWSRKTMGTYGSGPVYTGYSCIKN